MVEDDSRKFAESLQYQLNAASNDGFSLAQMIGRVKDDGLVLVHQKVTILEGTSTTDGAVPEGMARARLQ